MNIFNIKKKNIIKDIDGNFYTSVSIGTQVWMIENLKTTKYCNGDPIPHVQDRQEWLNLTTSAYCNYRDNIDFINIFGRLYNWYAVHDSRNIAPTGWHVATLSEWQKLIEFLGGNDFAGDKLKESGNKHWLRANTGATNKSGFTALPGGGFCSNVNERNAGFFGGWWPSNNNLVFAFAMGCDMSIAAPFFDEKMAGNSVRCVKD